MNRQMEEKLEIDKNDFSLQIDGQKIKFDAVFIGMHGTPGEDGKLQGYFDTLKIPYTSCDAATSALTFNKRFTVAVAAFSGISVANSVVLIKNTFQSPDEVARKIKISCFCETKQWRVKHWHVEGEQASDEFGSAIEKAFKEDDQVLIEEFIEGREFTVGVFKTKGNIIVLPITEVISKKEFFDYEAKYEGASRK